MGCVADVKVLRDATRALPECGLCQVLRLLTRGRHVGLTSMKVQKEQDHFAKKSGIVAGLRGQHGPMWQLMKRVRHGLLWKLLPSPVRKRCGPDD